MTWKNLQPREAASSESGGFSLFPVGHGPCSDEGMERNELEARSAAFADAVVLLCKEVSAQRGGRNHADQLSVCATSAAANYRATSRSRSRKEFAAKMGQVAEEADEAVYWLERVMNAGFASSQRIQPLLQEGKELRAIFAASYKTSRRPKPPPPRDQ